MLLPDRDCGPRVKCSERRAGTAQLAAVRASATNGNGVQAIANTLIAGSHRPDARGKASISTKSAEPLSGDDLRADDNAGIGVMRRIHPLATPEPGRALPTGLSVTHLLQRYRHVDPLVGPKARPMAGSGRHPCLC
jgi:hypothetical protein